MTGSGCGEIGLGGSPETGTDVSLPHFGDAGPPAEEPPPPPPRYDDDGDSVGSDEAVTVRDIPVVCIAGDVIRDGRGEALEAASSEVEAALLDEVSSAAEFLVQMPLPEAEGLLAALESGDAALPGHGDHRTAATARGQKEAVEFVATLIEHLPDRATALEALRSQVQVAAVERAPPSSRGGPVSQFLKKRRQYRVGRFVTRGCWEEHFTRGDESHPMRRYFYNNETQKTQWDPPLVFADISGAICEEGDELDF